MEYELETAIDFGVIRNSCFLFLVVGSQWLPSQLVGRPFLSFKKSPTFFERAFSSGTYKSRTRGSPKYSCPKLSYVLLFSQFHDLIHSLSSSDENQNSKTPKGCSQNCHLKTEKIGGKEQRKANEDHDSTLLLQTTRLESE